MQVQDLSMTISAQHGGEVSSRRAPTCAATSPGLALALVQEEVVHLVVCVPLRPLCAQQRYITSRGPITCIAGQFAAS